MKRRIIVALGLVAVLAVAVAATTSAATKKTAANSITVWLQVDAQTGWPDIVAAANQQFQAAHPGTTVNVQYQSWTDHLQKFDATLAGGGGPDVIEMGNTEMTKYMAAGAFAPLDKAQFDNSSSWLPGLAASGKYGGKTYGVPYYAGSRVVTYRKDLFKQAGISKLPATTSEYISDAQKLLAKNKQKGFSPVYIGGEDWYVAMAFVFDYGGGIATQVSGKWKGLLATPRSIAGLTAYRNFFLATSRCPARATRRQRRGPGSRTSRARRTRRRCRRSGTSRTPRTCSTTRSTTRPPRRAGSSRRRSTGSTSRTATSCARCSGRS